MHQVHPFNDVRTLELPHSHVVPKSDTLVAKFCSRAVTSVPFLLFKNEGKRSRSFVFLLRASPELKSRVVLAVVFVLLPPQKIGTKIIEISNLGGNDNLSI